MANTNIEWSEQVWQVTSGCTKVSAGCKNCYAETMANRLAGMARADVKAGRNPGRKASYPLVVTDSGAWNNKVITLPGNLEIPLHRRTPTTYFVNSMSDLFHKDVPFDFIDRVFAVMALCPHHTFQVLTKRPERMAEYAALRGFDGRKSSDADPIRDAINKYFGGMGNHRGALSLPLDNAWLGCSCENQRAADERTPHLFRCPAAVRFLSVEPLLEETKLAKWLNAWCPFCGSDGWEGRFPDRSDGKTHPRKHQEYCPSCNRNKPDFPAVARTIRGEQYKFGDINWVIVGGESGPDARPCNVEWIRDIVQQCKAARCPVFVKQLGARPMDPAGKCGIEFKNKKGGNPGEWPKDLRVREMPKAGVRA